LIHASEGADATTDLTNEEERVSSQDYEQKYTDPELREEIKEQIKASAKGGKKGQWSARKSQLLTQEYEKRSGGYKGEKGQSQKNLEQWTEEEWQTKEGDANARQDDRETKRYLPKQARENMSEEEQEQTERKKREGSKRGEQYVPNTDDDLDHMKKVNSYVKRHLGQGPKNDVEDSKWRYSLMNWGHDPLKG
jgi:Protein of unknown function (DUF3140)